MIDLDDINKTVDNKFWKHITKDTLITSDIDLDRQVTLEEIHEKVNNGGYFPSGIREFIIFNKSREKANRVARIVPSFHIKDYVLQYYLLKKIEEELSESIHANAYGSFRNFKYFKDKENNNHELLGFDSLPSLTSSSSFFKHYWIFEWKEFIGKARRLFQNKKYKFFIMFDIADFYSSINMLLLEKKVRGAVPKQKQIFVDLLFYYLQHCSNKFKRYIPEIKGIPQDEVGDISRILANFFLQSFDHELNEFAKKLNAEVLRYADDHIIYATNEKIAEEILFFASVQLQKIGLSINGAKVKDYPNRLAFKKYWAFDIHELMDKKKWKKSSKEYLKRNKDGFRWQTILLRFLSAAPAKMDSKDYLEICKELLNIGLVSSLDYTQMIRVFNFLPQSERIKFLRQLNKLAYTNNFNSYHFNLKKAIYKNEDFKIFFNKAKVEKINERIVDLKKFFN